MVVFSGALDGRPTVFNSYCSIRHTVAATAMGFFRIRKYCITCDPIYPKTESTLFNMSRSVKWSETIFLQMYMYLINFRLQMFNWCCLSSYLSINYDATIRVQALARDEAAVLTGEKDKTCSNFTWLPWTANWHWAKLLHCGSRHCWWDKRGPNWTRGQHVGRCFYLSEWTETYLDRGKHNWPVCLCWSADWTNPEWKLQSLPL